MRGGGGGGAWVVGGHLTVVVESDPQLNPVAQFESHAVGDRLTSLVQDIHPQGRGPVPTSLVAGNLPGDGKRGGNAGNGEVTQKTGR